MKLLIRLKAILRKTWSTHSIVRHKRGCMLAVALCATILMLPTTFDASAAIVSVNINGTSLYQSQDLLKSGVTYVPLRAFADYVGDFQISWNGSTRTATIKDQNLVITARVGDRYITSNGYRITSDAPNLLLDNRIYVPIRSIAEAMGLTVTWNASRRIAVVSGNYEADGSSGNTTGGNASNINQSNINQEDLYWLSRIISAESRGESMAGKIAVGTVVMNRVKSSMYPNTVYGVIFDQKYGTQFTPVTNGAIYNEPTAESVEAARRVLAGERTDSRILFFVNEKLAPNNWISKNRTYIMTIGNHKFYA